MGKVKSSIYIDEDLWRALKRRAVEMDLEISSLLEELIKDNLMIGIEEELVEMGCGLSDVEIDFEPIKPVEGLVSILIRDLRDERENSLFRH
ncbi:MAG: hypothetical protein QW186_08545 [Candidatus Bathyarchaeia archaeon]|nr:hypothetical protein [Candidatus Bathyarchaeota archaeon]